MKDGITSRIVPLSDFGIQLALKCSCDPSLKEL